MYSSFYRFSVDKGTKNTEHFLYSRKTDLYMDLLQRNHQLLLKGINCTFLRYLHARIEWEDRLIGILPALEGLVRLPCCYSILS